LAAARPSIRANASQSCRRVGWCDSITSKVSALMLIGSIFTGIVVLYFLASLIPSISVTVRRLHDIDKSGCAPTVRADRTNTAPIPKLSI